MPPKEGEEGRRAGRKKNRKRGISGRAARAKTAATTKQTGTATNATFRQGRGRVGPSAGAAESTITGDKDNCKVNERSLRCYYMAYWLS